MKTEEKMKFADEKVEIEQVIAYDALTVSLAEAAHVKTHKDTGQLSCHGIGA
jgi:hypothetical protein